MVYRLSRIELNVLIFYKKRVVMISLTTRTKSVALAFAIIISSSNVSCFSLLKPFSGASAHCPVDKKTLLVAAAIVALAGKVRLDTKPRGTYNYDNIQADVLELLNSYNIFDAEARATIIKFIDKYFVGSKFKKDEYTIRTKEDDGSVLSVKRNKVTQKPSGVIGLVDAYVLQQLKANNELLPAAAAMFVFAAAPQDAWDRAIANAKK
jgi:hypothetical protein